MDESDSMIDRLKEPILNMAMLVCTLAVLAMAMPNLEAQCIINDDLRVAAGVAVPFPCGENILYQGYEYATVQIGDQCWFAENLRTDAYANGDAIPELVAKSDWYNTTSGAMCAYGAGDWGVDGGSYCDEASPGLDACVEAESLAAYGRLYNWYAVDDARNLCPSGWHVPTDGEFQAMEVALGMSASEANSMGWQGTNEGQKLKADSGWPWEGAPGNDESGFAGLPGGSRLWFSDAAFNGAGESGNWWSASLRSEGRAWRYSVVLHDSRVNRNDRDLVTGFSVRCVEDNE